MIEFMSVSDFLQWRQNIKVGKVSRQSGIFLQTMSSLCLDIIRNYLAVDSDWVPLWVGTYHMDTFKACQSLMNPKRETHYTPPPEQHQPKV